MIIPSVGVNKFWIKKSISFPLFLFHTTYCVVYLYMEQRISKQPENAVYFYTN